jgi:hypothetical protein
MEMSCTMMEEKTIEQKGGVMSQAGASAHLGSRLVTSSTDISDIIIASLLTSLLHHY